MENSHETFGVAGNFARFYQEEISPRKERLHEQVLWVKGSRLNGLIADAVTMLYANHLNWFVKGIHKADLESSELGVYRVPLAPIWLGAYARTGELLAAMKAECDRLQSPLSIAILSGPQALGDVGSFELRDEKNRALDRRQPERWMEAWCRSNAVPCVNLGPTLSAAGMRKVFWRHDGHLNQHGNMVIASPIYDLVCGVMKRNQG